MYFAYVFIERFKSVDAYWVHQFLLHFAFFMWKGSKQTEIKVQMVEQMFYMQKTHLYTFKYQHNILK